MGVLLTVLVISLVGLVAAIIYGNTHKDGYGWFSDKMFALAGVFALLLLISGIGWGMFTTDKISCRNTAHNAQLSYRWSMSAGCMYQFNGHWIPEERWLYLTDK